MSRPVLPILPLLLVISVAFGLGCKGDTTPAQSPAPAPAAAPAPSPAAAATSPDHAPAGYAPGTWEDWCGGHAVPESVCTRCNPKLIPAFKATNDWCAEHGLPESQCLKCNPDLKIVRPPKADAPAPATQ